MSRYKRIEDGGPAFPRPLSEDRSYGDQPEGNKNVSQQDGMTLREYLAAAAMQGYCANPDPQVCQARFEMVAEWSCQQADTLIAQLAKREEIAAVASEG